MENTSCLNLVNIYITMLKLAIIAITTIIVIIIPKTKMIIIN